MQRYVAGMVKKFLTVIFITSLIVLGVSFTHSGMVVQAKEYTVSGETSQKIYESSSENSNAIANVIPGNSFTILETVKDAQGRNWHHVSLPGGVTGYVIASSVVEKEGEVLEEPVADVEEIVDEAAPAEENQNQENAENTQQEPVNQETPAEQADDGGNAEAPQTEENIETGENADSEENIEIANISVTTLSNINLRDEPSLEGNVLVVIPRGVTIVPYEKFERDSYYWYRLTYLTQTGYIRADAVEEHEVISEEATEETTEDATTEASSESAVVSVPKVIYSNNSTVSYEDSYDRRHKWDDPEIITADDKTVHKRFIDIYVIVFITIAIMLMVIAIHLFRNVFRVLKKNAHAKRKRKNSVERADGQDNR